MPQMLQQTLRNGAENMGAGRLSELEPLAVAESAPSCSRQFSVTEHTSMVLSHQEGKRRVLHHGGCPTLGGVQHLGLECLAVARPDDRRPKPDVVITAKLIALPKLNALGSALQDFFLAR